MTREKKLERIYEEIGGHIPSKGYNLEEEVLLGDVLYWTEREWNNLGFDMEDVRREGPIKRIRKICQKRKDKRKPIEEQSEECIDFIYSLLGDE